MQSQSFPAPMICVSQQPLETDIQSFEGEKGFFPWPQPDIVPIVRNKEIHE
jgi:hypothetical protein